MKDDPYFDQMYATGRLLDDYKKHGKLVIAYDFDNTVYDCHGKGFSFTKVREIIRNAKKQGHILICYTANGDLDFVKSYLNQEDIPFDYINESPVDTGGNKLYYNILLDDRAGLYSAWCVLLTTMQAINE